LTIVGGFTDEFEWRTGQKSGMAEDKELR